MALGVAVVIAIELAGEAAVGSFQSSLETLLGKADFAISANGGVEESWVGKLAVLPLNTSFSPVLEIQAFTRDGAITLYGIDALPRGLDGTGGEPCPDCIVLSSALARRLGIRKGGEISLVLNDASHNFPVSGMIDSKDSEFALLDIADAQRALRSFGKLDRIEVSLSPGEDPAEVERQIRALLPASYVIERPGIRSQENQKMLRAFRWNLRVLSYISLVVGAFLIYNTISVTVVRRRPEIGILRALGTDRRAILILITGEALMLGLAGSALGVGLGRFLAEGAVRLIGQTVNELYTSSRPGAIQLSGVALISGIAAGMLVAFVSALGPALTAMQVSPTEAMGRGAYEQEARLRWRRDLIDAGVLGLAALALSRARPVNGMPLAGYIAALLAIGAAALSAPALILGVTRASRVAVRRWFGAEGMLAARSLAASLARTSVVVGALATAIAMMASVAIMVGSFRETVQVWLDQQLRADLYVRPAGRSGPGQFPGLSADVPAMVASVPGVEAVDVFHGLEFRYRGEHATLGAGDLEIVRRYGRLRFLPGEDRDAILRSLPGHDRAIVSEPFANKHAIRAGDRIELSLGERNVTVTVAGIYFDYSSERGYVILDRGTLLRYLPGQPATNLAVYLHPAANATEVRGVIQQRAARYRIVVVDNSSLRRQAVTIFDRTFAITYALEGVAIVVAMLGAANSLLALVLDRRRELGLLRFLGAAPRQIRRMILLEAGFLGLIANLLGLALGFALSLLLIYVVNKQSFGWTIQLHPPFGLLAGAVTLVWIATVLAALYPGRVASRLNPIEVIHEE